jgi:signal transduction histidine kinase
VRDNGKGIARNEHKRIFEKFYRVDDLLSRQQEGSGLGLSIVQHVMRAHRGRIEVESEPGNGSAFTLLLPRRRPKLIVDVRDIETSTPRALNEEPQAEEPAEERREEQGPL